MDTTANDGNASARFRFNLRTLLLVTALLSIPLTLFHWLGTEFLVSMICSTGLVLICSRVYRYQAPKQLLGIAALAFPLGLAVAFIHAILSFSIGGTGTFLFHTLINFAVCVACVLLHCPRKVVVPVLILTAVIPYYSKIQKIQAIRNRFDQWLVDYPLESLEPRLAFENTHEHISPNEAKNATFSKLSSVVTGNLAEQEQRYERRREWALEQLHENFRTQFAAAAGFGYMRMRTIHSEDFAPEPIEIVRLPLPVGDSLLGETNSHGANRLHRQVAFDFLSRDKIGYVRDKQHVAGFQSHSPTYLTDAIKHTRTCGKKQAEPSFWQLTRLELISLLRHSPPRVYLAESLPAMDQLDQFEHRALTPFEQESLKNLRTEQDVVVDQTPGHILMVGALRASQDCLACHQGNPGKLLGAFSYEFARSDERWVKDFEIAGTLRPNSGLITTERDGYQ